MCWNGLVARHRYGHLLQTEEWAALKRRFGWESDRVTLKKGNELVAGAQVLYRWLPLRMLHLASVAYVPKGPVVDWERPDQVRRVLEQLRIASRQRRAALVRIEPALLEGQVPGLEETLAESGFRPAQRAVQPRRTVVVDIGGSEDQILNRMRQKTRYNIRLAERKGVVVREGGQGDLVTFCRLMAVTGQRDEFGVHSPAYYRAVFDLFAPQGAVTILIAEFGGRPLAALMVFVLGRTAWYLYGASNDDERSRMPAYLLQWKAICWARARGCQQYDLWGVPDEDRDTLEAEFANRSDGLWGVYRFKRGFGGRLVRWVGAYDLVLNHLLYGIVKRAGY